MRLKRKITALLCAISVSHPLIAANLPQLDPKLFASLDNAPSITVHLDDDRISKALIRASTSSSGDLITPTLLDAAITEVIESEIATPAITKDLANGDDYLRQTMLQVLAAFNVPPVDANSLVLGWAEANGANNQSLRAVLFNATQRPEVMQRLRAYFMNNDIEWARVTLAFSLLLGGEDKEVSNAMAISLANATGNTIASTSATIAKAQSGDFQAKWLLSSNLAKVMAVNGAMARVMRGQQLTGESIYEKVWLRVAEKIASDPLLVEEYARRSYALTPLFDNLCTILIGALSSDTERARPIGKAMVNLASIPGSRFEWMSNEILGVGGAMAFKKIRTEKEQNSALEKTVARLGALMSNDPAWCEMLFWHLTRVGEAAVLTTRLALPETIVENDRLATLMVKAGAPFGSEFDAKLARAGAYTYYPGGAPELRAKIETGEVEVTALRHYMKAFASLLAVDDVAWDMLFANASKGPNPFISTILGETIDRSVAASSAWIQTIQNNDQSLKTGFVKYLVESGSATDMSTANLWIESVSSAVSQGTLVGNTEVAKLKEALVAFISSQEGWRLMEQRISAESYGFPSAIRQLLVYRAITTPNEFWPIYRKLTQTNGDTVSILKSNITNYMQASSLPTLVLDETAAQNPFASDSSSVLWDKMMAPESSLVEELARLLREGFTMNLAYGVGNLALIDVLATPDGWSQGAPYAAAFFNVSPSDESLQRRTMADLASKASETKTLTTRLLEDSKIKEMWRQRCLAIIKFLGKAPPVAATVRKDSTMEKEWRQEISTKAASDAFIMESLVNALGMRRVGDAGFSNQLKNIRSDLAKMVFYDRILFEQVLADKNRDYRMALLEEVKKKFGTYIEQQWK